MKPVVLTMTAFGPYAAAETIDFRDLGDAKVFLIHGPTGAGKSTILDAICYALYGETSGNERSPAQMRSHHCDPDTPTEVQLDFAVGEQIYRVLRAPEHERAKQRGDGTTKQPARATLWRRVAIDERGEGTVLATKWSAVTEKVEAIIGFTSEEFRQVVMLPQGQFRKLLLASSSDRERILETLFRTAYYRSIQDALQSAERKIASDRERTKHFRSVMLEPSGATSLEELRDAVTAARERAAQARATVVKERERRDHAGIALATGRRATELIQRATIAEKALADHVARMPAIDERRRALGLARSAVPLQVMARNADDVAASVTAARERRAVAVAALEAATDAAKSAEEALRYESGKEKAAEHDAARDVLRQLRALSSRMGELEKLRQARIDREKDADSAATSMTALVEFTEAAKARLATARQKVEEASTLAAALETLRTRVLDAERIAGQREELERRQNSAHEAELAATAARAIDTASDEAAAAAGARFDLLVHARDAGRATALAGQLETGKPCPVCGSREHPAPATGDVKLPSEAEVNAARAARDETARALVGARSRAHDAATRLATERSAVATIIEQLADAAASSSEELRSIARAAATERDRAAAAASELERTRASLAAAEKELGEIESRLDDARRIDNDARAAAAAAVATFAQLDEAFPQTLKTREALDAALARGDAEALRLERALEEARKRSADANVTVGAETARVDSESAALATATEKAAEVRAQLADALARAGFMSDAELRAVARTAAEIDVEEAEIGRFDRELAAARSAAAQTQAEAAGTTRPDLAALEREATEASAACDAAIEAGAKAESSVREIERLEKSVADYESELAALDARYAIVGRIAALAAGSNGEGLPFHRFVLGAMLDDVLSAASVRLKKMSQGRYLLVRSTERGDRRATTGLEIEVEDSYTGTRRAASTLSGGESFLAALALALGLADVVEAYAGGVRLESVFVDEGFGSLDPDSLDLAVAALFELQQSGRLVGVISHVPELRERIDARLAVELRRDGSRARFDLA